MTNAKHTPGPWEHVEAEGFNRIVGLQGEALFLVGMYGQFGRQGPLPNRNTHIASIAEEAANARLIAAAPELLDALEAALPFIDGHKINSAHVCETARAAIAKARGE